MRKKLLVFIAEGFSEERELARETGMDLKELEKELEEMCGKGYLKVIANPAKNMCSAGQNLRDEAGVGMRFELTKKGKELVFKSV